MDRAEAFKRFCSQRSGAKARGIEWCFSFDEWLAWWGADLGRRGLGHDQLQMQRLGDQGPYAPHNVRKGYPKDNGKTRGDAQRHKNSLQAKADLEAARDAAEIKPDRDERSEDEHVLDRMFRVRSSFETDGFVANKRF